MWWTLHLIKGLWVSDLEPSWDTETHCGLYCKLFPSDLSADSCSFGGWKTKVASCGSTLLCLSCSRNWTAWMCLAGALFFCSSFIIPLLLPLIVLWMRDMLQFRLKTQSTSFSLSCDTEAHRFYSWVTVISVHWHVRWHTSRNGTGCYWAKIHSTSTACSW